MNPDDIKKLLEEYSKKYVNEWAQEKYYDPDYELMIKKNDMWDYSPTLDYPDMYTSGIPSEPRCTYTEEERAARQAKWTGALVKFATHIGGNAGHPLQVSTGASDDVVDLNMTGTIFETMVNYQDRWTAQVLWANGAITSEKIDDLVIVQPLPTV